MKDDRPLWTALATALVWLVFVVAVLEIPSLLPNQPVVREEVAEYSEGVVALPGFDPLYGYVYGNNCDPSPVFGCASGATNYSQIPVLANSPEQPAGVYYINNASELVRVSGGVSFVAHVIPLGQRWAQYAGMTANAFFLPYGYDEALLYGTYPGGAGRLTVEAVNLSSGARVVDNTSLALAPVNQQAMLISPTEALVASELARCSTEDCPANLTAVNLTSGVQRPVATLPFFEANNLYWVPPLRELIDVEADGSVFDRVEQWNETANGSFVLAATVTWSPEPYAVDWVNGLAFEPGAIAFSAGGGEFSATVVLHFAGGLLTGAGEQEWVVQDGPSVRSPLLLNGQQYVYTGDWVLGGFFNGTQYLVDPWNGTSVVTNEPFTDFSVLHVCDGDCFLGSVGTGPFELIDFHASLARNDPFWSVVLATFVGWESVPT